MKHEFDPAAVVGALRRAFPYMRNYQGKTFLLKAGGEVFETAESTRQLMEQVGVLHRVGIRVVLVHGGGIQATTLARELGIEVRMVEGRRVTDARTRDVATMVLNGTVNTSIVASCRDLGIPALGLSGVDAGLIQARKRPPRRTGDGEKVDYGYVGDIVSVDTRLLRTVLEGGFVPIVSPLSADDEGVILNINADVVAARLARELGAEKLVMLTGARGILRDASDPASLVSYTDAAGLEGLDEAGAFKDGMLPKADAIRDALRGGVRRVHVISHKLPDSLLIEVFTNEGCGTMVVADMSQLTTAEATPGTVEDEAP